MEIEAFTALEKIALIQALEAREKMLTGLLFTGGRDIDEGEVHKLIQDVYNVREKLGLSS